MADRMVDYSPSNSESEDMNKRPLEGKELKSQLSENSGATSKYRKTKQETTKSDTDTLQVEEKSSTSESGSFSPSDDQCSICLGRLENKSFTDSCFHKFCFVCLVEWSKVRAVCPLCKQPFTTIVHNVQSYSKYDEYKVTPDLLAGDGPRFRYRTTMGPGHFTSLRDISRLREQILMERPSRRNRLSLQHLNHLSVHDIMLAFRRRVYAEGLAIREVRPPPPYLSNRMPPHREVSAEFYRQNPACTHRLFGWLRRELGVLRNSADEISSLFNLIITEVEKHDIVGERFYRAVRPFLGNRSRQFISEFLSFARSPYADMEAYDSNVVYNEADRFAVNRTRTPARTAVAETDVVEDRITISSQPSSTHSDVVVLTPENVGGLRTFSSPRHRPDATTLFPTNRSNVDAEVTPTTMSGWESPIPSSSGIWSSLDFADDDGGPSTSSAHRQVPFSFARPASGMIGQNENILDDSSNSEESVGNGSDVLVIGCDKPWQERSPILLSSDEEVDIALPVGVITVTVPIESCSSSALEHVEVDLTTSWSSEAPTNLGIELESRSASSSENRAVRKFQECRETTLSRSHDGTGDRSRSPENGDPWGLTGTNTFDGRQCDKSEDDRGLTRCRKHKHKKDTKDVASKKHRHNDDSSFSSCHLNYHRRKKQTKSNESKKKKVPTATLR